MMRLHVNVTQRDIDSGKRYVSHACPIARAIGRHNAISAVAVDVNTLTVYTPRDYAEHLITLPSVAFYFRHDFDNGRPVAPFAFDLVIPD